MIRPPICSHSILDGFSSLATKFGMKSSLKIHPAQLQVILQLTLQLFHDVTIPFTLVTRD